MFDANFLNFMYERHADVLVKILKGHGELLTPHIVKEYREWLDEQVQEQEN